MPQQNRPIKKSRPDNQRPVQPSQIDDKVPMMFRAQIQSRCSLQNIDPQRKKERVKQDVEIWVDQWKTVISKGEISNPTNSISQTSSKQNLNQKQDAWQLQLAKLASSVESAAETINVPASNTTRHPSDFGEKIYSRTYKLSWRLSSNSGCDPSIHRPTIGSQGYPFYTGSSMKGAFLRALRSKYGKNTKDFKDKQQLYCGHSSQENIQQDTSHSYPSNLCLRFHGGYPLGEQWKNNLIDLVHPQESKQVTGNPETISGAMSQITLHDCELKFGISSAKSLSKEQWDEVWDIWEVALSKGLGGHTSAGYGCFAIPKDNLDVLVNAGLEGRGVASKMLNGEPEIRPNMFKAALRSHTLRLFSGLTNETKARYLTEELWGGITDCAKVGLLGTVASFDTSDPFKSKNINEPTFHFQGNLKIILTKSDLDQIKKEQLIKISKKLLQFSMLLGGFGKSWRRVDHNLFKPQYPKKQENKKTGEKAGHEIGCHWVFQKKSEHLYLTANDDNLNFIKKFIDDLQQDLRDWAELSGQEITVQDKPILSHGWRESFCLGKVQIWARLTDKRPDAKVSKAVHWLHDQPVKGKNKLGGATSQHKNINTSRIWHRMYPLYRKEKGLTKYCQDQYIEILSIFPFLNVDKNSDEYKSYQYLQSKMSNENSKFELMWGDLI